MKALLEKIESLRKPVNPHHVEGLIKQLGEAPSIATIEEVLKYYKKVEKDILSKDLLEWMMENDMYKLETEEFKVDIKTYVSAKIANEVDAFEWLAENNYADLIKTNVAFPRGEFTEEAQKALEDMGASFTRKDKIEPQSLKKIISDRLVAGESLPDEDQGIKTSYFDQCQVKEK